MSRFVSKPPGRLLEKPFASEVRRRFLDAFVQPGKHHLPFWFSLPLNPVPRAVMWGTWLRQRAELYFLVGNGARVFVANGNEVSAFFRDQHPLEDFALYVFDTTLLWCLASTDELVPTAQHDADFLVLGVGLENTGIDTRVGDTHAGDP